MGAIDFGEWVAPDLELTLGGHTYKIRPPSVEAMKQVLAAGVLGEVKLGLVQGDVPDEVQKILDTIGNKHPALGSAYEQMVADEIDHVSIDRMAVYAVFYWARGKEYADSLAKIMWLPRDLKAGTAGGAAPKG
jgi:hypothetical protein